MASNLLASDDNNPDFMGAKNPDGALAVRFYVAPLKNEWESEKAGRPIYRDVEMIEIMVPGDSTSIINQMVREDHKARFPLQWAHFMNKHGGDSREVGTPLSQWPRLSQSQVEELRGIKIYTVENVASMSDINLQKIGMIAGMNPHAFREHAARFLKLANDDSLANAAEERAKALEDENRKLKEETEKALAEMRLEMQAMIAAQAAPKKRGRPRKVEKIE